MRVRLIALLAVLLLGGCFSINSDLSVGDGETVDRSLNTVNGSVTVGADSTVSGSAKTVNGSVSIGRGSSVRHVETVNGKISLGPGASADSIEGVNGNIEIGADAEVAGAVETVNGRVLVGENAVVDGLVAAVNGQIRLEGATVGALENYNGGMVLAQGSRVLGELRVSKPRSGDFDEPVLVEIHADCEVAGPLVFERPVQLRIHESANVGEIRGAEPEYFSG
ncbi:MAG: hypothetical protein ACNS61_09505 [Candidatus Wenzhouxiangella sp. M2_3B_020]